jgi:hypothetical protein
MWRASIALVTGLVLLTVPPAASAQSDGPRITRAPSLSAVTSVGQRLDATGATWTGGRAPLSVTWGWLRCDSDSIQTCRFIETARVASYTLTSSDRGKRIRAVVIVSDRDDRYAYAWSGASGVIANAPPPVPTPVPTPTPTLAPVVVPVTAPAPAPVAAPAPVIAPDTTPPSPRMMNPSPLVRIQGWLTPGGAMITRLTVRAPRGVKITAHCFGRGCSRKVLTRAAAAARRGRVTRLRAFEGRFRAGTRFVITVTRPGAIGKHTIIRIRRDKQPFRRDRCLFPGSEKPAACPTG